MAANGNASMSAPPDELCCPLSGVLMTDPVILVDTGDTYNRRSIEDWRVAPPPLSMPSMACQRASLRVRDEVLCAISLSSRLVASSQVQRSRHPSRAVLRPAADFRSNGTV